MGQAQDHAATGWHSNFAGDIDKLDDVGQTGECAMTTAKRLPAFDKFIRDVRAAWKELPSTEERMKKVQVLLEGLVKDPSMREHSKNWPSTEGHKNLLLYEEPDCQFVINAVVRTPGRDGRIHDHAHAWTAYGVLDGIERLERYRRIDDGAKQGYALIELESLTRGYPGKVDLVAPYAIHSEKGGPTRSVAVIVRSERLVGRTLQGRYDAQTDKYTQSEGPTQVPFEVT
jgi:predicted metal-dependent enzyme (double-stranded beta helix superfamily)